MTVELYSNVNGVFWVFSSSHNVTLKNKVIETNTIIILQLISCCLCIAVDRSRY